MMIPRSTLAESMEASAREGAWERSVALERAGRCDEARLLLEKAWGRYSDSYEVTARIAWLSMCARHYQDAVVMYRRARTMPGAGPEATNGLAAALAALKQAAERRPAVDAWLAYQGKATGPFSARGASSFVQLTLPFAGHAQARAAYRYVQWQHHGPPTAANRGAFLQPTSAHEIYGALAWTGAFGGFELMGFGTSSSDGAISPGGAGRFWFGRRLGMTMEGAALRPIGSWAWQVLPSVFLWPIETVVLSIGPRLTRDAGAILVSWTAGLSLVWSRLTLSAGGHWGREQSPVNMAVPLVLNFPDALTWGANGAVLWSPGEMVRIGVAASCERMSTEGVAGLYWTLSGGITVRPSW